MEEGSPDTEGERRVRKGVPEAEEEGKALQWAEGEGTCVLLGVRLVKVDKGSEGEPDPAGGGRQRSPCG